MPLGMQPAPHSAARTLGLEGRRLASSRPLERGGAARTSVCSACERRAVSTSRSPDKRCAYRSVDCPGSRGSCVMTGSSLSESIQSASSTSSTPSKSARRVVRVRSSPAVCGPRSSSTVSTASSRRDRSSARSRRCRILTRDAQTRPSFPPDCGASTARHASRTSTLAVLRHRLPRRLLVARRDQGVDGERVAGRAWRAPSRRGRPRHGPRGRRAWGETWEVRCDGKRKIGLGLEVGAPLPLYLVHLGIRAGPQLTRSRPRGRRARTGLATRPAEAPRS